MEFQKIIESVHLLNSKIGGEWDPHFQLLWIYEEMGELSRELLKLNKLPAKLHNDNQKQIKNNVKEEFGDILYGLISLAKNLDLDMVDALKYSLEKFQRRHNSDPVNMN